MTSKNILPRTKIADFIDNLYDGDLHAKRVLSLANATLGVLVSASLAVHAIGQGLAQALGKLSKHGVKQVDRLLSNQGIDVWEFFGCRSHIDSSCGTFAWKCHHVAGDDDLLTIGLGEQRPRLVEA